MVIVVIKLGQSQAICRDVEKVSEIDSRSERRGSQHSRWPKRKSSLLICRGRRRKYQWRFPNCHLPISYTVPGESIINSVYWKHDDILPSVPMLNVHQVFPSLCQHRYKREMKHIVRWSCPVDVLRPVAVYLHTINELANLRATLYVLIAIYSYI